MSSSFALLFQFEPSLSNIFKDQTNILCSDGYTIVPHIIFKVFFENVPDFSAYTIDVVTVYLESLLIDCSEAYQTLMWKAMKLTTLQKMELIQLHNSSFTRNTFNIRKQFYNEVGKSVLYSTEKPKDIDMKSLLHFLPASYFEPMVDQKAPSLKPAEIAEFKELHLMIPTSVDSKRGPKVKPAMIFHPASYNEIDVTRMMISKIGERLQRMGIGAIDSSHGFSYCIQAKNAKATKLLVDFSPFTNTDIVVSPAYIFASLAKCPVINSKDKIKEYLSSPKTFDYNIPTNDKLVDVVGQKIFIDFSNQKVPQILSDNISLLQDIFKLFECEVVSDSGHADFTIRYEPQDGQDHQTIALADLI